MFANILNDQVTILKDSFHTKAFPVIHEALHKDILIKFSFFKKYLIIMENIFGRLFWLIKLFLLPLVIFKEQHEIQVQKFPLFVDVEMLRYLLPALADAVN